MHAITKNTAVIELLGDEALNPDGTLNRALVASRIFGNEPMRRALETRIHPLIHAALESRKASLENLGEPLLCYEASLLVENGRADLFRPLVLVVASEALQMQRVARGDSHKEADVRARIAAQLPVAEKVASADIVISNEGTLEQLRAQADAALSDVGRRLGIDMTRYTWPRPQET